MVYSGFNFAIPKIINPMNLTDHIEKIAKKSKDSHMALAKMRGLSSHINQLKKFLDCSHE